MIRKIPPLLILLCLPFFPVRAQTAEQVLEKFHRALNDLKTLSYSINNIDTFPGGKVWDKKGYCILKREADEPVLGFLFNAKRADVDEEAIYYGSELHWVNRKVQTYKVEKELHQGMLGSPAGQMVLQEIFRKIKGYDKLSVSSTDTSFVLKATFPDIPEEGIKQRYRELHIDRKTYIPFYAYRSTVSDGMKSSSISHLSDISINPADVARVFEKKDHINNYRYLPSPEVEDYHQKLVNNEAPDFELLDTDNNKQTLSRQTGKVIVLDFWELRCGFCLQSIEKLKALSAKYSAGEFEVWSIVSDESSFSKVKEFSEKRRINYRVMYGTVKTSADYHVYGVPLYVIIDKEGIVRYAKAGATSELEQEIEKYVN
ncbi:MAG TPA: TlpA disulfide reductase family protein [Chryseosolibacter sp.]